MIKKLLSLFLGDANDVKAPRRPRRKYSERDLLRKESLFGRQLFGPIPSGHQREFFCLDDRTWIWYEKWTDPVTRKSTELTTRYELHTNGIIKIQADRPYQLVEGEELKNLVTAMELYSQRVGAEIYHYDSATGQPLPA